MLDATEIDRTDWDSPQIAEATDNYLAWLVEASADSDYDTDEVILPPKFTPGDAEIIAEAVFRHYFDLSQREDRDYTKELIHKDFLERWNLM